MEAEKKLEFYFPSDMTEECIHIIVQPPNCKSSNWSHPLTGITDTFPCAVPSAGQKRRLSNDDTGGEPASKRTKIHSGSETLG
jgi:hypothetical protein